MLANSSSVVVLAVCESGSSSSATSNTSSRDWAVSTRSEVTSTGLAHAGRVVGSTVSDGGGNSGTFGSVSVLVRNVTILTSVTECSGGAIKFTVFDSSSDDHWSSKKHD